MLSGYKHVQGIWWKKWVTYITKGR